MTLNKVVLDTSVLLIPGKEQKRDIFLELLKLLGAYEAIVPSFVVTELESLISKKRGKTRDAAKLALSILENIIASTDIASTVMEETKATGFVYKVRVEEAKKTKKTVDDSLIDLADKMGARICTSDKKLRQKAEKKLVNVLFIGSKKYPKKIRVKR